MPQGAFLLVGKPHLVDNLDGNGVTCLAMNTCEDHTRINVTTDVLLANCCLKYNTTIQIPFLHSLVLIIYDTILPTHFK